MILVFIFLGIIILNLTLFLILLMSNLHIEFENFKVKNFKVEKDYIIHIQLYFINKIKYFSIKIDDKKMNSLASNEKLKRFNNMKKTKNSDLINAIKMLKIKIEKLDLRVNIGLENVCLLSYLVAIISSLISIVLPYFSKENSKIQYKVIPEYSKNIFNLNLKSIISLKVVHIIYVIYFLGKKGGKKNERTSNRGAYVCSYE